MYESGRCASQSHRLGSPSIESIDPLVLLFVDALDTAVGGGVDDHPDDCCPLSSATVSHTIESVVLEGSTGATTVPDPQRRNPVARVECVVVVGQSKSLHESILIDQVVIFPHDAIPIPHNIARVVGALSRETLDRSTRVHS